jgi:hypothetical protein
VVINTRDIIRAYYRGGRSGVVQTFLAVLNFGMGFHIGDFNIITNIMCLCSDGIVNFMNMCEYSSPSPILKWRVPEKHRGWQDQGLERNLK